MAETPNAVLGIRGLMQNRLPLNRKEVYFTATVLPALICSDRFSHFGRFLELIGLTAVPIEADPGRTNIQFFTEYSLAEAIYPEITRGGFTGAPTSRERPDLLVLIEGSEPLLIAIEAKLYSATQKFELIWEMQQQKLQLDYFQNLWPELRIVHVALLPSAMKSAFGSLETGPIVTWEEILETFGDVVSAEYFVEVLRIALEKYPDLKSKEVNNADDNLLGSEILARYQRGDVEFQMMGRQGGIGGFILRRDIDTGAWPSQRYEVRRLTDDRPNWFSIARFVDLIKKAPRQEI